MLFFLVPSTFLCLCKITEQHRRRSVLMVGDIAGDLRDGIPSARSRDIALVEGLGRRSEDSLSSLK